MFGVTLLRRRWDDERLEPVLAVPHQLEAAVDLVRLGAVERKIERVSGHYRQVAGLTRCRIGGGDSGQYHARVAVRTMLLMTLATLRVIDEQGRVGIVLADDLDGDSLEISTQRSPSVWRKVDHTTI
jgi:hypothetical protein